MLVNFNVILLNFKSSGLRELGFFVKEFRNEIWF